MSVVVMFMLSVVSRRGRERSRRLLLRSTQVCMRGYLGQRLCTSSVLYATNRYDKNYKPLLAALLLSASR